MFMTTFMSAVHLVTPSAVSRNGASSAFQATFKQARSIFKETFILIYIFWLYFFPNRVPFSLHLYEISWGVFCPVPSLPAPQQPDLLSAIGGS